MRMSEWTPEIVGFMEDATVFGTYFDRVADLALRGLVPGARVCDAGCGLGQLAERLAAAGCAVEAVDVQPAAVAHARRRLAAAGLLAPEGEPPAPGAVRVQTADFMCGGLAASGAQVHAAVGAPAPTTAPATAPAEPCERMVFSLSASAHDALLAAQRAGARSVVVLNKMHPTPRPEDAGRPLVYNLERAVGELTTMGLPTQATEARLRFDQPFRTLDDARRFFALFRTRAYPAGPTEAELRRELVETGRDDFPWALPVTRHLACFNVDLAAAAEQGLAEGGARELDRFFAACGGGRLRRAS